MKRQVWLYFGRRLVLFHDLMIENAQSISELYIETNPHILLQIYTAKGL